MDDIKRIADLQLENITLLFLQVPKYAGFYRPSITSSLTLRATYGTMARRGARNMNKCIWFKKALQPIGNDRSNGKKIMTFRSKQS